MINELQIFEDIQKEISYAHNGEGYISQRGVARLVGVNVSTVSRTVKKLGCNTLKLNENNQIHQSSFLPLLRSIGSNTPKVLGIVEIIEVNGVRSVFKGVTHSATPLKPLTKIEMYEILLEQEKARVVMLGKISDQKSKIEDEAILTNKSKEYFPISHVRKLNPNLTISHHKLSLESSKLGYPVKQLFSNYDAVTTNTYAGSVWMELYEGVEL
jgi:hypothetical protein